MNYHPTELQLQNYIQNKLSDSETEQLELWLADHPKVMEDLEMGEMFKQADLDPNDVKDKNQSWFDKIFTKPVLIFSHAIVFAFGMFLFNLLMNNKPIEISNPQVAMFSQTRGNDESFQLSNSKGLLIQIPVDYLSQSLYQVSITGKGGLQFNQDGLKPDSDIVSLYIPKGKLVNGDYNLTIINLDSQDNSSYKFIINNELNTKIN